MERSIYRLNLIMLTLLTITLNFTELASYILTDSLVNIQMISKVSLTFIVSIALLKIFTFIEIEKKIRNKQWYKSYRKISILFNILQIVLWNLIYVFFNRYCLGQIEIVIYLLPTVSSLIVIFHKYPYKTMKKFQDMLELQKINNIK
ncbi:MULTISPECIES: hypothetical protein [Clostridium]|uniref:Uncharacterized protein n=1 Tax=Clostridium senegalense TaxID=1465809 RepID=A0A6M0H9F1_9CLOT|nr:MULTISPECIES: hypothetical protein [Clostridium]NEU06511.1 hypothetical protein [Clostridium senegalense]